MIRTPMVALLLVASVALSSCGGDSSQYAPAPPSAPDGLDYPDPNMFTEGVAITPLVPTLSRGTATNYTVTPDLPAGLILHGNGEISGTPTEPRAPATYLVTAGNSLGTTSFGVRITVAGRFTIGGNVSGLTGTGLVLTNNGSDDLAVTSNGPFQFARELPAGGAYSVAVATQPPGQTCSVADGSGTLTNDDFGSVVVTCSADAPKAQRADVAPFNGIRALVIDDSGTLLYAACTDAASTGPIPVYARDPAGVITLLGDLHYEPGADANMHEEPRVALHAQCGRHAITLAADGRWAVIADPIIPQASAYLLR